jgi:hypothetical protein
MPIQFIRWALIALLSLGTAGCASGLGREETKQTGDASDARLSCDLAGFSRAESLPCVHGDSPRAADLVVQTTSERAREDCAELTDFASTESRWTLEIASPGADAPVCTLHFANLADMPAPFWPVLEKVLLLAIDISPQEANDLLRLMIGILEEMRAHLAETSTI